MEFCYLLRDSSAFFKLLRLLMPPLPTRQPPPFLRPNAGEGRNGDEKRTRKKGDFFSVKTGLRSNTSSLPREKPEASHGATSGAGICTGGGTREDTARSEKESSTVHTPCLSLLGKPPEERRLPPSLEVGGSFSLPSVLAKKMLHLLDVHLNRNLRRTGKNTAGQIQEDSRGNDEDERGRRVDDNDSFFPLSQEQEPTRSGDSKESFMKSFPPVNMTLVDGPTGTRPAFPKAIRKKQFPLGRPVVRGFSVFPWGNRHALLSALASSELSAEGETEKKDVYSGDTASPRKEACFPEAEPSPVTEKRQDEEQLAERRDSMRRTGAIDEEEEEREEETANGEKDFRMQREALYWLQVSGLHHFLPKIVEWSEERCSSDGYRGFPTAGHTGSTRSKGLSKLFLGRERRDACTNNREKMREWGEKGNEEKDVSRVAAIQIDLRRVHPLLIRPFLIMMSPFLVEHFEGLTPRKEETAKVNLGLTRLRETFLLGSPIDKSVPCDLRCLLSGFCRHYQPTPRAERNKKGNTSLYHSSVLQDTLCSGAC